MEKLFFVGNELSITHSDLCKDWDCEKNYPLTPDMVTPGSNKKVWWKCHLCSYEWQATISHRASKQNPTGCPVCVIKSRTFKRISDAAKKNNFVENYPVLASEWNFEKNGSIKPEDFSSKSNAKVWWKCPVCNFEWEATINKRTSGRGCPNCNKIGTSFAEQTIFYYIKKIFPDAINRDKSLGIELDVFIPSIKTAIEYDGVYYHSKRNSLIKDNFKDKKCAGLGIRLIRFRDPKLQNTESAVRITCKDDYGNYLIEGLDKLFDILDISNKPEINIVEDQASIISELRINKKQNSIVYTHPDLVKEWHPLKNIPLKPENISSGSDLKVWWKCLVCGSEWQSTTSHRVSGRGCPVCAGKIVVEGVNDFKSAYPNIAEEWCFEKNGEVTPDKTVRGSQKKVWWKCKLCGFIWKASPYTRSKNVGCPACAGKVVYKGVNDLETLFPEISEEWNYEKNEGSRPSDFTKGSKESVWWRCSKCGNEWRAVIYSRTSGRGCPECAKALGGKKHSLIVAENNSFVKKRSDLLQEWDFSKNENPPENYSLGSNYKVWWKCNNGHSWQATINTRSKGIGCPYCSGRKVLVGFNDLTTVAPHLIKEWNYEKNTDIFPEDFTKGSHKKVWWKCSVCGNEWQAVIKDRVRGTGCPKCNRKTI